MMKQIQIACRYTVITAIGLGIIYPVCITAVSQLIFRDKANGQLISVNGEMEGSRIIGQPFTGAGYFHSRPSAAGSGYDATSSSGSNLAPTSKALIDRIGSSVAAENGAGPVPVDLVTASGSGLDPDISPAAALYQVDRVARDRHLATEQVRDLVMQHIEPRQFGLLGEPTVNVLELNLALMAEASGRGAQ
jgi:K+-transporting ATPase ATPase C chain